jgi:hypothetical protein
VTSKAGWSAIPTLPETVHLPAEVWAVIERARRLTLEDFLFLERLDAEGARSRLVAWAVLRDALDADPAVRSKRLAARDVASIAVGEAAIRHGMEPPADDYWEVTMTPAAAATRLARFAACAAIPCDRLDADNARILSTPWTSLSRGIPAGAPHHELASD